MAAPSTKRNSLTVEQLKELLHYDPDTGAWTWLIRPSAHVRVGDNAGSLSKEDYRQIQIDGVLHRTNRLAFLYMTGEWPKNLVDHKDNNKSNERWDNLRDATRSQNNANAKLRKDNVVGFKGVSKHAQSNKFHARIRKDGKLISLGLHETAKLAHAAYVKAAQELHGEFGRAE